MQRAENEQKRSRDETMDGTLLRGGVVRSGWVQAMGPSMGHGHGPWLGYEPLATDRAGALVEVP